MKWIIRGVVRFVDSGNIGAKWFNQQQLKLLELGIVSVLR